MKSSIMSRIYINIYKDKRINRFVKLLTNYDGGDPRGLVHNQSSIKALTEINPGVSCRSRICS